MKRAAVDRAGAAPSSPVRFPSLIGRPCTHEYLLAFSCKARYFCPSCHAKRLALWTVSLEESLLAQGVPHRQVVLTIPKRLRAWCLYRRSLLGDLAHVADRDRGGADAHRGAHARGGHRRLHPTQGSLANWHPHIHMIATDGGFRAGMSCAAAGSGINAIAKVGMSQASNRMAWVPVTAA